MAPPQEPKKSKAERFQEYLSRRVHGPSDATRPVISNPRPFHTQNVLRPEEMKTLSALREEKARAKEKAKKENPVTAFFGSFKMKKRANSDVVSSSRPTPGSFRPSYDESRVRFRDEVEEIIEVPVHVRSRRNTDSTSAITRVVTAPEVATTFHQDRYEDVRRPRNDGLRRPREGHRPSRSHDDRRPSRSRDERRPSRSHDERSSSRSRDERRPSRSRDERRPSRTRAGSVSRPSTESTRRAQDESLLRPITQWPSAHPQAPAELRVPRATNDPSSRQPVPAGREVPNLIVQPEPPPILEVHPALRVPRTVQDLPARRPVNEPIARRPVNEPIARQPVPATTRRPLSTVQHVPHQNTTLEPRTYFPGMVENVVLKPEHADAQVHRLAHVPTHQVTRVEPVNRHQSVAASVTSRYSRAFDSRVIEDFEAPPVPRLPSLPFAPTMPHVPSNDQLPPGQIKHCRLCKERRIYASRQDICSWCMTLGFVPPETGNRADKGKGKSKAKDTGKQEDLTASPSSSSSSHSSARPPPLRLSSQAGPRMVIPRIPTTDLLSPLSRYLATEPLLPQLNRQPAVLPPQPTQPQSTRKSSISPPRDISPVHSGSVSPLTPSPPRQRYATPAQAPVAVPAPAPQQQFRPPPASFMGTDAMGYTWLHRYRAWEAQAPPWAYEGEQGAALRNRILDAVAYYTANVQDPVADVVPAVPGTQQGKMFRQISPPPEPFRGTVPSGESWKELYAAWRTRHPTAEFVGEGGSRLRGRLVDAMECSRQEEAQGEEEDPDEESLHRRSSYYDFYNDVLQGSEVSRTSRRR